MFITTETDGIYWPHEAPKVSYSSLQVRRTFRERKYWWLSTTQRETPLYKNERQESKLNPHPLSTILYFFRIHVLWAQCQHCWTATWLYAYLPKRSFKEVVRSTWSTNFSLELSLELPKQLSSSSRSTLPKHVPQVPK